MKIFFIGLLALSAFSVWASVEVTTDGVNQVELIVTVTATNGLETCNAETAKLVSRLEKTNRIVLDKAATCFETYRSKIGETNEYVGKVYYLKY